MLSIHLRFIGSCSIIVILSIPEFFAADTPCMPLLAYRHLIDYMKDSISHRVCQGTKTGLGLADGMVNGLL